MKTKTMAKFLADYLKQEFEGNGLTVDEIGLWVLQITIKEGIEKFCKKYHKE